MTPRITPFAFEDNPLYEGQYVQVHCIVSEGDLPLMFDWKLNGKPLETFPEATVSLIGKRSSILTIDSVSYTHAGNYTCEAKNQAGIFSYTAHLHVNG